MTCTFCLKEIAIYHCAECQDFYCQDCEVKTHLPKKRRHHHRKLMSKLSMDEAAGLVTRAVRPYPPYPSSSCWCLRWWRRCGGGAVAVASPPLLFHSSLLTHGTPSSPAHRSLTPHRTITIATPLFQVRYHGHLLSMQNRCRNKIRRYVWRTQYPYPGPFAKPHHPPTIYW
jgi:hypothetical protein